MIDGVRCGTRIKATSVGKRCERCCIPLGIGVSMEIIKENRVYPQE